MRAVACLHPFRLSERLDVCLPVHLSIQQILLRLGALRRGLSYSVAVNGELVEERVWDRCYPDAFSTLAIRAVPAGGGSDDAKDMLRGIATLGVMVGAGPLAPGVAGFLGIAGKVGTSLTWAALSAGGAWGINQLIPPPDQQQMDTGVMPAVARQNNLNPYGTVPRVYGRHRIFPSQATLSYVHDGTYYALFLVGYGRLDISDIKVGDESIDNSLVRRDASNPEGQYEVREGYSGEDDRTLTPPTVTITEYNHPTYDDIPADEQWHQYTTESCEDLIFKLVFPNGLGVQNTYGSRYWLYLRLWIQARPTSGGAWTTIFQTTNYDGPDGRPGHSQGRYWIRSITRNLRKRCSQDQARTYEIQIKRGPNQYGMGGSEPGEDDTVWDTVRVYQLHTLLWADPINMANVATIAIAVPTDLERDLQWNRINCVAHSYLDYWNGSSWVNGLSSQPAAVCRDILMGSANTHAVAEARLDLTSLQDWAEWTDNVDHQYYFNGIFDRRWTNYQAREAVCAIARASPVSPEAKFGVIWDRPQTEIVQHLTPRNTWGFSSIRSLPEKLHGIRMRYRDAENFWMDKERVAYRSGYNQDNATNIEERGFWGCTDNAQADNLAWYWINVLRLRLERVSTNADIENLVLTRGDLTAMGHDVPLHASGWGRVLTVTLDGGSNCTAVVVDEQLYLDAAGYRIQIRSTKGTTPFHQSIQSPPIVYGGTPGYVTTLTFTSSIPAADPQPQVGDLFIYGKSGTGLKYVEYLVAGILPHEDLSATIELIEFQQASVFDPSTSGSYDPGISVPPYIEYMDPPRPIVLNVQTDEGALYRAADGSLMPAIVLTLDYETGQFAMPLYVHCEWREWTEEGTSPWQPDIVVPGHPGQLEIRSVEQGRLYELRLRTVAAHNRASAWVVEDNNGQGIEVIGKSSAPPDPEGLYLDGDTIRWGYDLENAPLDFLGFEVRRHAGQLAGWDYAKRVHSDVIKGSQWQVAQHLYGTHTYYVKAVDTSHNYSTNAASSSFEFGEPEIPNEQPDETRHWREEGWPGTRDGFYIHAEGYLLAEWGANEYKQASYTTPHTAVDYQPGFWDAITLIYNTIRVSNTDSWWLEYRADETGWKWVPWPGLVKLSTVIDVGVYYQFRLTTAASPRQACVHHMRTYQGTPNIREIVKCWFCPQPMQPRTIELTKKFTHIDEVTGTIVESALGVHPIVHSVDPNVGPDHTACIYVGLLKPDGSPTNGDITWNVRGYRWRMGYDT
ncbi:MAG: hypothetical protein IMY86_13875 [Chloroflexi bacterium]|nr:hypothetical protein [Chloroflexota bacterium]